MVTLLFILLPMMLVLVRVGAFLMVLPLFGWRSLPMRVRAGMALVLTIFICMLRPPSAQMAADVHWLSAILLLGREMLCGLGLGLSVALIYRAIEQGGRFAARQMGFAMANVVNPMSGESSQPLGLFFEITFSLFFLVMNGHHLLLAIITRSYDAFPIGEPAETAVLCECVLEAGAAMLVFALRMSAPLLAAFVLLTVMLGVLARAMPEMNVLMISFPVRIGLGLLMAAAMTPYLNAFTYELSDHLVYLFGS